MFTRLLQLAGAQVIATDLLESRLRLARKFGARWVLNAGQASSRVLTREQHKKSKDGDRRDAGPTLTCALIHRATHGCGLDAAVIAVPSDEVVRQAQTWLRGGGQILLFAHTKRATPTLKPLSSVASAKGDQPHGAPKRSEGGSTLNFPLDLASVCLDEKDLLGSYSSDFTLQDEVARLVFSRQLDVRCLITHRFPLAETAAAVQLAGRPTKDSLKIIVGGTACRHP